MGASLSRFPRAHYRGDYVAIPTSDEAQQVLEPGCCALPASEQRSGVPVITLPSLAEISAPAGLETCDTSRQLVDKPTAMPVILRTTPVRREPKRGRTWVDRSRRALMLSTNVDQCHYPGNCCCLVAYETLRNVQLLGQGWHGCKPSSLRRSRSNIW